MPANKTCAMKWVNGFRRKGVLNWKASGFNGLRGSCAGIGPGGLTNILTCGGQRPYDPEYVEYRRGLSSTRPVIGWCSFYALRDDSRSCCRASNAGRSNSFFFSLPMRHGANSGVESEVVSVLRFRRGCLAWLLHARVDPYRLMRPRRAGRARGRAPAHAPDWGAFGGNVHRFGFVCPFHGHLRQFYFRIANLRAEGYQLLMAAWVRKKAWASRCGDAIYRMSATPCGSTLVCARLRRHALFSYGDPRQVGLSLSARF